MTLWSTGRCFPKMHSSPRLRESFKSYPLIGQWGCFHFFTWVKSKSLFSTRTVFICLTQMSHVQWQLIVTTAVSLSREEWAHDSCAFLKPYNRKAKTTDIYLIYWTLSETLKFHIIELVQQYTKTMAPGFNETLHHKHCHKKTIYMWIGFQSLLWGILSEQGLTFQSVSHTKLL